MFLETNWQHLSAHVAGNQGNSYDFGQRLYGVFDKYSKSLVRDMLQDQRTSELSIFVPAPILGAAFILLAELKCVNDDQLYDELQHFKLTSFLDLNLSKIDSEEFLKQDHKWLKLVLSKYQLYFPEESDAFIAIEDVLDVVKVLRQRHPEAQQIVTTHINQC